MNLNRCISLLNTTVFATARQINCENPGKPEGRLGGWVNQHVGLLLGADNIFRAYKYKREHTVKTR